MKTRYIRAYTRKNKHKLLRGLLLVLLVGLLLILIGIATKMDIERGISILYLEYPAYNGNGQVSWYALRFTA